MPYAHLTKTKRGYEVRITNEIRPIYGFVIVVGSRKAARALAAEYGATPWNF